MMMARSEITNPNFLLQTDEQRNAIYKRVGIDPSNLAGTAPAAPQAAPQQGAAPAAGGGGGKKMYNGKLYTREEYERDVLGK